MIAEQRSKDGLLKVGKGDTERDVMQGERYRRPLGWRELEERRGVGRVSQEKGVSESGRDDFLP